MKSLYFKVLVWSIATVALVMTGLIVHSRMSRPPGGPPFQTTRVLADIAQRIYATEGREALREFVRQSTQGTGATFYVTDATGHDLLTGDDRSALLAEPGTGPPGRAFSAPSSDGSIRWIHAFGGDRDTRPSPAEAFLWILAAVSLMAYLFTFYLVSPLRKLAIVVERFGAGDLSVRAGATRGDELGNLARAFDKMAERIHTLVTSERQLLQDISHELRTPLARMRFAVEVARTDPDRMAALDRIRKECDRLSLLTDELLESCVGESRAPENADLVALLHELAADASIEAAARRIVIDLHSPPAALSLDMDRELLRRALENVLRNAIRYSPDGQQIDVTLTTTPATAEVAIRDRGPGVSTEMLDKIFEPFFRAESHRARLSVAGGVGLGLAIARRAVQRHHGSIRAENVAPGLCVVMTLPRAAAS
jgi:two-component system sensor histidine kinase CpxA